MFEEIYKVIEQFKNENGFVGLTENEQHYLNEGVNLAVMAIEALEDSYLKENPYQYLKLVLEDVYPVMDERDVVDMAEQVFTEQDVMTHEIIKNVVAKLKENE